VRGSTLPRRRVAVIYSAVRPRAKPEQSLNFSERMCRLRCCPEKRPLKPQHPLPHVGPVDSISPIAVTLAQTPSLEAWATGLSRHCTRSNAFRASCDSRPRDKRFKMGLFRSRYKGRQDHRIRTHLEEGRPHLRRFVWHGNNKVILLTRWYHPTRPRLDGSGDNSRGVSRIDGVSCEWRGALPGT